MKSINGLIRRGTHETTCFFIFSALHHVRIQRREASVNQQEGLPQESNHAGTLISDSQPSERWQSFVI